MFLAPKINRKIAQLSRDLSSQSTVSHQEIKELINKALKPFGAKVELQKVKKAKNFLTVGGYFETDRKRQPITIEVHVSSNSDKIKVDRKHLDGIMFLLFQTLCHELIHKYQCQHRHSGAATYYMELDDKAEMTEEQIYLAEVDEIDAYAHDIALELMRHFPDTHMKELSNIQSKNILSYHYYVEHFNKSAWCEIRKQLLRKVYQHIIQIKFNGEHFNARSGL